jgi:hypothetical protein
VQIFFNRVASCRARNIFFLFLIDRSLPLLGAQIIFFLLAAAQQRLCALIFFICSVRSLLHRLVSAPEFFLGAVRSHPAVRTESFFSGVRSAAVVHAEIFFSL